MDHPVSKFIETKSVAVVALATGRSPGAVRVWKHRKRFPREAWGELITAFPGELTLDRLREMAAA